MGLRSPAVVPHPTGARVGARSGGGRGRPARRVGRAEDPPPLRPFVEFGVGGGTGVGAVRVRGALSRPGGPSEPPLADTSIRRPLHPFQPRKKAPPRSEPPLARDLAALAAQNTQVTHTRQEAPVDAAPGADPSPFGPTPTFVPLAAAFSLLGDPLRPTPRPPLRPPTLNESHDGTRTPVPKVLFPFPDAGGK